MSADVGRNIDPALGALRGEGATIQVESPEHAYPTSREIARRVPSERRGEDRTYYDEPVLKEPVWIWSVPAYFLVGGTAGAASALAATAQALDPRGLRRLIRAAHVVSLAGELMSAGLLIHDLGRPARFLNMLRVFRPSSPMSVGSWILTASGGASAAAVLFGERRLGRIAGYASGILGLPLAGYTGVLIACTAVPVWQGGRRALPPLFLASSAASAGALLSLLPVGRRGRRVAQRFQAFGDVATLAMSVAFAKEVGRTPRAVRPLGRGVSGTLWGVSRGLTAASLLSSVVGSRVASSALALAGAAGLRAAVFLAGKASARDPRATFRQQRPR